MLWHLLIQEDGPGLFSQQSKLLNVFFQEGPLQLIDDGRMIIDHHKLRYDQLVCLLRLIVDVEPLFYLATDELFHFLRGFILEFVFKVRLYFFLSLKLVIFMKQLLEEQLYLLKQWT